jgi:hypothetical protein
LRDFQLFWGILKIFNPTYFLNAAGSNCHIVGNQPVRPEDSSMKPAELTSGNQWQNECSAQDIGEKIYHKAEGETESVSDSKCNSF